MHFAFLPTAQIRILILGGAYSIFHKQSRPKHMPQPACPGRAELRSHQPRSVAVSREVATSGKLLQALVEPRLAARSISSRKAADACGATATWREAEKLRGAVARGTCKAPSTRARVSDQVA